MYCGLVTYSFSYYLMNFETAEATSYRNGLLMEYTGNTDNPNCVKGLMIDG